MGESALMQMVDALEHLLEEVAAHRLREGIATEHYQIKEFPSFAQLHRNIADLPVWLMRASEHGIFIERNYSHHIPVIHC